MTADDFRAFFGIKVEYRRGVHQDRLSAQLLKYLVRQLIASHMRENQLVIDDTAQRVECVQHHVGRAVDVVAVSNINAGVCDNIQSALCRRLHNAQVTHVVKAMRYMGVRCIFNTHMHDLARSVDELNAEIDTPSLPLIFADSALIPLTCVGAVATGSTTLISM